MRKVGIIGCGAIGSLIASAVENGIAKCDLLILYDSSADKAERLKISLRFPIKVVDSVDEMIREKPSVIVEAASQQAAREQAHRIVSAGIDLIVMSVGALLDLNIKSNKIHVPSGAIGGLDAISGAALAGVEEVVLTTRKSPTTLDAKAKQEQVLFEGDAREAIKLFPREMNVAATLALAVSPEKVKVRVISDPNTKRNVHEIAVRWKYGQMHFEFANDPHPDNPKTSALAAWSAIKLLKNLLEKRT